MAITKSKPTTAKNYNYNQTPKTKYVFCPSARTVTVNNNDNNDNYSNSDSTATTSGAEANNNNDNTTNGSASTAAVVLRLASGDSNSRKRGRSPTAAAASSSSRNGGVRRGILKRPRTSSYCEPLSPAYVPAPVPEIIANVEDATIPGRSSATRTLPMRRGTPSIGAGRPFAGRRRSSTMLPRRWSGPRSMRCSRTSGGTSN